jgi:hypothetical protein
MADAEGETTERTTKVERVIEEYHLHGLAAELAERWTAPSAERDSLRELARYVNRRILEAALAEAGVDVLEGELENYYRLLTDDDVSAGRRTEARSRLEHDGVDVDAVEGDFVSHQAIHTFLTERAGVSFEGASSEERIERTRESLERLQGRVETVAENNLDRLAGTEDLDIGDVSVLLSLDVVCNDCGQRYDLAELLEVGGCECQS